MLKERRVIGIVLPVVMWARIRHGQIDEFKALAVFGLFDLTLGRFDNASDSFDMRIKRERREAERDEEGEGEFHGSCRGRCLVREMTAL